VSGCYVGNVQGKKVTWTGIHDSSINFIATRLLVDSKPKLGSLVARPEWGCDNIVQMEQND